MSHKHSLEEIINVIQQKPGLTVKRLCCIFDCDISFSLSKLEFQGRIRVEYEYPEFIKKKIKHYFPISLNKE